MKILVSVFLGIFLLGLPAVNAQVAEGAAITFDYSMGSGKWTPYEHVITDYFKAFPYMTDTGNISPQKKGYSFGITSTQDRMYLSFHIGSLRSTAWADGLSPMGGQWSEVLLVKTNVTELSAGYFFIRSDWFRMGITGGLSYNVTKMKSERSDSKFQKAKEGKFIYLNPGNATNFENTLFLAARLSLPIAIGRKVAFCIEPFASIPFWKVNTSEVRKELIPNSTPAYAKDHYRGFIPCGGVRLSFCIGMHL